MAKKVLVPVTKRALVQRINRKLAKDGERLLASRSDGARQNLGDFYIIDSRNIVIASQCEIESLGREIKVLAEWEKLEG